MLDPDRIVPATVFPLFSCLPEELRREIWLLALPGPRIIHVQRYVRGPRHRPKLHSSESTYFGSPSPQDSITSLLRACKASNAVVKAKYSRIFPSTNTWFSFSNDFLYLDWGMRPPSIVYGPEHFAGSRPDDSWTDMFSNPEVDEDVARKVKNLVVYGNSRGRLRMYQEMWLAQDVLSVFRGVKTLVLAEQMFIQQDVGEELVWLRGELGEESKWSLSTGDESMENRKHEEDVDRICLDNLVLWRVWRETEERVAFNERRFKEEWEKVMAAEADATALHTRDCERPTVVRKGIITATTKKDLLRICHSEENFRKLWDYSWGFVKGTEKYMGGLDLSQQITFFKLAIKKTMTLYEDLGDVPGYSGRDALLDSLMFLQRRLDALMLEQGNVEVPTRELVINEAEERGQKNAPQSCYSVTRLT